AAPGRGPSCSNTLMALPCSASSGRRCSPAAMIRMRRCFGPSFSIISSGRPHGVGERVLGRGEAVFCPGPGRARRRQQGWLDVRVPCRRAPRRDDGCVHLETDPGIVPQNGTAKRGGGVFAAVPVASDRNRGRDPSVQRHAGERVGGGGAKLATLSGGTLR